nr:hypothetical protein [Tanacetum cinerariifolium]
MANEEENHALVADDKALTEFALLAKSSSSSENEVFDDSFCSKSYRKNTDSLNAKITKLNEVLSDSKTNLYHYKLGLSQIEARLVEFKTQEIKLCEKIRGLEFDVKVKNNKIENLMNKLEQVKKEKEGLDSKLTCFESASKDLDNLLGSQRSDKNKEGLGYNDTITDYSRPSPSIESNSNDLQKSNSSISEHGESSSSILSKPMIKFGKAADSPTDIKTNKVKTVRKSFVRYAEMYRNISKSSKVRGKNWPKNNFAHKNVTPKADLLKTASVSAARPVNTAASRPNVNSARLKTTQDLNGHYALWEVIEFDDSYEAPPEESGTGSASKSSTKKKGRTVAIITEDMQKRRNDVKARTTLLLALPDEHQLRFSKRFRDTGANLQQTAGHSNPNNQSWPLIESCACLDHHLNPSFSSKIMGFPAWYFSWVMVVVEMEMDLYPGDFEDCCRGKGGKRCTGSKIMGFPAWHFSWVMVVVEMEMDLYPGDFEDCCRGKGRKRYTSGGQSATHRPTTTATAAGKAAAVAAVGVAVVLVVGRDDGVMEAVGGVGGGAWHGGCCHGGAGCRRRCMAMVDGG